jgi:tetratricopeptide (TPR) repeat protein
MFRILVAAAVLLPAALSGCGGVNELYNEQMFLGEHYYRNGKYGEAMGRYTQAVEFAGNSSERYKATLQVANASTEYGLVLYEVAESLIRNHNRPAGKNKLKEADKVHDNAHKAFTRCLQMRPDDRIANYYLGLFFYKRATSFSELPYPGTPEGMAQRCKERDEAVRQFEIVLGDERGDITLVAHLATCKSPQLHRYLALALFARSDWDRNDSETARRHVLVYLHYIEKSITNVIDKVTESADDKAKKEKQAELDQLRQELVNTRALLTTQHQGLKELLSMWEQGKEEPRLVPAKRDLWMNAARREIAALASLRQAFEDATRKEREREREQYRDKKTSSHEQAN